jgi:hypothetical protein
MPWTGKASYDNFGIVGIDVSPIVELLSPYETPFLDLLPPAERPAISTAHTWVEEQLGPDVIIASAAVNSAVAATGILINGLGAYLQAGMLLELQSGIAASPNEIVQVSSAVGANSVLVTRNVAAAGVTSLAPGGYIHVLGTAELEGSTTSGDYTRPRVSKANYTQIFKKAISISGTDRAIMYAPSLGDEFDHQTVLRTRELMRDLEKVVFRGRAAGNSIGSASAYRTMDGLIAKLTTVNSTLTAASFTANPLLYVNNLLQSCYNVGARDIDVIACGSQFKRDLSEFATTSRITQTAQDDNKIIAFKDYIQTDFGTARLVMTPWLRASQLMCLASGRIRVIPLQGRSFKREDMAKTGDSDVAHVIGEYTLEVRGADGMAQASV